MLTYSYEKERLHNISTSIDETDMYQILPRDGMISNLTAQNTVL